MGRPPGQQEQWGRAPAKPEPKAVFHSSDGGRVRSSKGIAVLTFWDKILLSLAASLASTHQMPAEVVTTRNIVDLANVPWKAKSPLFGAPVSETSQAMMRSVVLSFKEVVFFSETWWC